MTPNWGAFVLLLSVFILGLVLLAGSGELWLALWCAGLLAVSFPLFVWKRVGDVKGDNRSDAANRLTAVTGWDSNSTTYSYDEANRMTGATLPSSTGIVSAYTYDDADRLTGISHVKDGTTTVASVAYTLDDVGNRTGRVDQQGTHTYAYDDLYRLHPLGFQRLVIQRKTSRSPR